MALTSVELFSGAGGLAMGLTLAGFRSHSVVEWDKWACETIRQNQERRYPLVSDWPLVEGDVRQWIKEFGASARSGDVDLVAGGPPCQPFSLAGKHRAHQDNRDMFPATVDVIRRLRPRAFIVENVKGLTRSTFHSYYQYILLQLEFPEITIKADDSWSEHHEKLQRHKTAKGTGTDEGLTYRVIPTLVNAANFGIPQKRERVFIVGFRSDIPAQWAFPSETHSADALLYAQWITGEYWDTHKLSQTRRAPMTRSVQLAIDRMRSLSSFALAPSLRPWSTVRDALRGLPDPELSKISTHNHRYQPGARIYPGHTGSPLDQPAKTLKAGDHGVPGGENMMVRDDGSVRYFTVRESARLQTFPDGYVLHGSWSEAMRQLGNAVPVELGRRVAASVAEHLLRVDAQHISSERTRNLAFA